MGKDLVLRIQYFFGKKKFQVLFEDRKIIDMSTDSLFLVSAKD